MKISNVLYLLKRHFIEKGKFNITGSIALLLSMALLTFIQWSNLFIIMTFSVGSVTALLTYSMLCSENIAMDYLMIPASTTEKYVVNGILVYVYYNVLFFVTLTLGELLGSWIHELVYGSCNVYVTSSFTLEGFIFLLMWESIMMFGSVYYRKTNAGAKTLIAILIIFMAFVIFDALFISLFYPVDFIESIMNVQFAKETIASIPDWFGVLIITATFVFFNFMTWLRLKETEA